MRENVKKKTVSTQIRLSEDMHRYIQKESRRIGIAQNAFLAILLESGRKLWEADIKTSLRQE